MGIFWAEFDFVVGIHSFMLGDAPGRQEPADD